MKPSRPPKTLPQDIERPGLIHGLSHPVALLALAGLVVNDWYLKGQHPSWLTGKLSDVCWLVVTPLVVAALLTSLPIFRRPRGLRLAKGLSISGVGAAFVLLQVWPPLGETWVGWFGGSHTPDLTDLFALPALAGALLAWTYKKKGLVVILPVALVFSAATSTFEICDWDKRYPCNGATDVDPGTPFVLYGASFPIQTYAFQRAITLVDSAGQPADLVFAVDSYMVFICPAETLKTNETYTWTVGPFESDDHNSEQMWGTFDLEGAWTFVTASEGDPALATTPCLVRDELVEFEACAEELALKSALPECDDRVPDSDDTDQDRDGDGFTEPEDCDDTNSEINPNAEEICDGFDNNCDGEVDEGVAFTFYSDVDADGFGLEENSTEACDTPSGYVAVAGDCDDENPSVYPGADEYCNDIDDDCDGEIDEGLSEEKCPSDDTGDTGDTGLKGIR